MDDLLTIIGGLATITAMSFAIITIVIFLFRYGIWLFELVLL